MKALLLGLGLAILPSVASASVLGVYTMPDGSQKMLYNPPQYYLDNPFRGQIDLQMVSRSVVTDVCTKAVGHFEDIACTWLNGSECRVMIADDLPNDLGSAVLQHEYAHCAGWSADHPLD